ncbi:acyl-CoA synthetase [Candidatus Nitrosopelagicus brevis]|uniref:Acyl-CoA synthetase n=1 Tax=Candidatus Nitrosopelagicus brevis TaxID=1410606 RepID=A0A0A7V7S5_9ARCH|nr:4-hydroxybutyrate--CoA ligase [Candidatus Nitrosopelagicus brevis]AJA92720.1 putative acetyl coenzyme A synthetase (ADP forming), alpha domain protein [Candidatus Nitrosopelagicus brevis]PTL88423.1 acyl-CoA synthetase [Candidatus Nitrosopelagicus brevis]
MTNSVFLSPKSIAIIGASDKEGSVGRAITNNIMKGYKGTIYPISPTRETVFDKKAYKSVLDVPGKVDLAVVVTKNTIVPAVLEECGKKKLRGAIVITAGFKEVDEEGAKLEQKLKDIAKKYKLQIIGPNCLGVMNLEPQTMMNSTFLKITPKSGEIALVSQSGAICAALVEDASAQGIGFSAVISMGNKADMSEIDILKMLAEHKQTKVIVIYLEDMGNGQEFLKVCKDITRKKKKPVLVLKSGRSPEGAKAAMSHTGALMGSDEIYDALLKQSGAIRVDTMEELFDYATAFSKQPLPMNGDLVIVSNAGGPAIISTDACSKLGIKMAKIEEIRKKIDAVIPPWGSSRNPVDIVGDADFKRFENVLNEVLKHKNVGSVISMCTPSATLNYDKLAEVIVSMSKKYKKTMLASLMGLDEGITNREILAKGDVPYYTYAEGSIRALKAMLTFTDWVKNSPGKITKFNVKKNTVKKILDNAKKQKRSALLEEEGQEILRAYGFPLPASKLAKSKKEAVAASKKIGYPVVLKIASPQIIHKSDAGGVKVNLQNAKDVENAFDTIIKNAKKYNKKADIKGVLVVEMVKGGKEMIIGSKLEPGFGPVVMLGMGGIYVEVLKDVTFRLAPMTNIEADDMISSIKTKKILEGVRGEKPSDIKKLSECIQRLSQLVSDFNEIKELDMNPVLVMEKNKGCKVLDVRIGL